MPKITRHGGPSIAGAQIVGGAWSDSTDTDGWPDLDELEGGEESSPGSSSETSPEKQPTSPETSEPVPPKPARTTASRSKRAQTGNSTARSTAGSGEADADA